ncbi:hypothetical protein K1719_009799 [Acacia pycnantha]|nr:hypothetical protein K1719_009799 [Acacia pycnantha]
MWKSKQPLKVIPLSNDYYILSFSSQEDCDYAYHEGPWMIDDHYLIVQRWRPNFNPRKADCQRKVAVWVRIPDLPMEFCTVESLGLIGNMIAKIIKIDRSTSVYDKCEFARICVEVDLQKPLLSAFTTFGEAKQLVYEGLHLVCFDCGLYGHVQEQCPNRSNVEKLHVSQQCVGVQNKEQDRPSRASNSSGMEEDLSGNTEKAMGEEGEPATVKVKAKADRRTTKSRSGVHLEATATDGGPCGGENQKHGVRPTAPTDVEEA